MNEPDFEPKTAWRLYLLPGLAFILAMLLIVLAAMQAPALAEADQQPAVTASLAADRMPVVPDQEIIIGDCPGLDPMSTGGCTVPSPGQPIYLQDPTDRWTLYHEMGHRYAVEILASRDLVWFGRVMRYRWTITVGSERIADAYASCAFGWAGQHRRAITTNWPTALGYWPTAQQQERVCAMFRGAAARIG